MLKNLSKNVFKFIKVFSVILIVLINLILLLTLNKGNDSDITYYSNKFDINSTFYNYLYSKNVNEFGKRINITNTDCLKVVSDDKELNINSDIEITPASSQKIFTALSFLKYLKENNISLDEKLKTEVLLSSDNTLYIKGGYDPLITTQAYRDLLAKHKRLENLPVTKIEDLVLQIKNKNVSIEKIVVESKTFNRDTWTKEETDFVGRLNKLTLNGGIENLTTGKLSENPALLFGNEIKNQLKINVPVAQIDTITNQTNLIASISSTDYYHLISEMLIQSDNLTAESLADFVLEKKSLGNISQLYQNYSINQNHHAVDASGLSPHNETTCNNLITSFNELSNMLKQHNEEEYLAISGKSGTLAKRLSAKEYVGRIAAKTGSIKNVSLLVGVETMSKTIFVIGINEQKTEFQLKTMVDSISKDIINLGNYKIAIDNLKVKYENNK